MFYIYSLTESSDQAHLHFFYKLSYFIINMLLKLLRIIILYNEDLLNVCVMK